ncbi:glycoside hydrolase family 65 protein [Sinomonas mesophila]|uniref:glycoside hydrolase family 65 protein n=1 Tax=Sinomonas mesophila TaxID=1531955 RepID=UPI000984F425|nr:glycosyl hydrolase family 65 protein [Sinomonas mesophila]
MTLVSADRRRFPAEPWSLVEAAHVPGDAGTLETLFTLGNGHLGLRGAHASAQDAQLPGTFINGFHETFDIRHAENAYGFAKQGQRILYVPDGQEATVRINGEELTLAATPVLDYRRTLDFAAGVYECTVVWQTSSGAVVTTRERRAVGAASRASLTIELVVTADRRVVADVASAVVNRQDQPAEDGSAHDPRRAGRHAGRVLSPLRAEGGPTGSLRLAWATAESRQRIALAVEHETNATVPPFSTEADCDRSTVRYVLPLDPGEEFRLEKRLAYAVEPAPEPEWEEFDSYAGTAASHADAGISVDALLASAEASLRGIEDLAAESAAHYARYWATADVEIGGQPELQQAVRWNLFQLAQATAQAGVAGIPAKGVSGSGYEGHYFWDQEVYLMPYLTYTAPDSARQVLEFRHRMLPAAKARAAELNVDGALFPWRTINGQEASAYYAAGTAQFHINAAIAFAASRYAWATGDEAFRTGEGAELLSETARMWASLGFFGKDGKFHLHGVTGPDEYTAVVNDNLYTNVMARFNLRAAASLEHHSVSETDRLLWTEAAARMALPYDVEQRVHAQDNDFMTLQQWDWDTPRDKYPLLLHFHPLVIYRHQVLKQADTVLAMFLQWEDFTDEEKQRAFDFYDPITTGDSTLSPCVQGIMAAEVGYTATALAHFTTAAFIDLDDLHGNTVDGVHTASAGGVWAALANGFAGFRDQGRAPRFDPRLPEGWESLAFRLRLRGRTLAVRVTPAAITLGLEPGPDSGALGGVALNGTGRLDVEVRGRVYAVGAEPISIPLEPVAEPEPSVFPDPTPTAGLAAVAAMR